MITIQFLQDGNEDFQELALARNIGGDLSWLFILFGNGPSALE